MCGVKIEDMKETGSIIKCMAMEKLNGQMVESMKDHIKMIKNMEKVFFIGLMVANILETGKMESNTEWENILFKMEIKKLENGLKEREFVGLMVQNKTLINKTDIISFLYILVKFVVVWQKKESANKNVLDIKLFNKF